jgi:hypothetical protein
MGKEGKKMESKLLLARNKEIECGNLASECEMLKEEFIFMLSPVDHIQAVIKTSGFMIDITNSATLRNSDVERFFEFIDKVKIEYDLYKIETKKCGMAPT